MRFMAKVPIRATVVRGGDPVGERWLVPGQALVIEEYDPGDPSVGMFARWTALVDPTLPDDEWLELDGTPGDYLEYLEPAGALDPDAPEYRVPATAEVL